MVALALALAPPARRVARVVVEALGDEDEVGDAEVGADGDGGGGYCGEEGACEEESNLLAGRFRQKL